MLQWLLSLEIGNDPIVACRLMNIFRRKGLKIGTLTLASQADRYSLMALVESPETEAEHIFNYLRCTADVHHVEYFRHHASADASFVFIDGAADTSSAAQVLETFPGARLLFAGQGKYLLEVPADSGKPRANLAESGFMTFARVRSTREAPQAVPAAC